MIGSVAQERHSAPSFGLLTSYPPTPCGLATFAVGLSQGLAAKGASVSIVRVADGREPSSASISGELVNGSKASVAACANLLNQHDIAVIQHAYDLYGGDDGDEVLGVIGGLQVPSVVIVHTVLKNPTPQQRSVLEAIVAKVDRVVVMSKRP